MKNRVKILKMINYLKIFLPFVIVCSMLSGDYNFKIKVPKEKKGCNFNDYVEKGKESQFHDISSEFNEIIDEVGYLEKKGYMLSLIFRFSKVNDMLELNLFKLVDHRKSILDEKLLSDKCKKRIEELLPKYMSTANLDRDCDSVSLQLTLRACS